MGQPAGISHVEVGDIRVTYLPDGRAEVVPETAFPSITDLAPEVIEAHRGSFDDEGRLVLTLGAFLVETGDRKMLVDAGFGAIDELELPGYAVLRGGGMLESLRQIGYAPQDITDVAYSHLHIDHCGWTAGAGGAATFPNARLVMHQLEWEQWRGVLGGQLDDFGIEGISKTLASVERVISERVQFVEDGGTVAPGVNAMLTPGHTNGHLSFVVSSGDQRAVILGDPIACTLQISVVELDQMDDVDQALARRSREAIARELEKPGTITAGGHFSPTTFGRVVVGEGRRYFS